MKLKQGTKYDISALGHGIVDLLGKVSDEGVAKTGLRKGGMTLVNAETIVKIKKDLRHVTWEKAIGGSALNTIRIASILGLKSYYSTSAGKDELGDFMINELHKLKIDEDIIKMENFPTATLLSMVTPDAERTMGTCLGAAEAFSVSHIKDWNHVLDTKIFYFTGYKLTNNCNKEVMMLGVKKAREKGVIVGFDMADAKIMQNFKKEYEEIIPFCDIIFMNNEEAVSWGKTVEEAINNLKTSAKLIVAKTGKKGCLVYNCEKEESVTAEGFPVNPKDTTGAGDSFAAGFLYGLIKGMSLQGCASLANFVGSRVVQNIGALLEPEQIDEIKNKIKELELDKKEMINQKETEV